MGKAHPGDKKVDARKISRKLRPKQRRFIAQYADPTSPTFGNGTQSAIAAGYSQRSAAETAYEILRNPKVVREIEHILDQAGATREKSAKVIKEALDATVTRVFCPGEGELVYAKPLVDHQTRLKAAEMNHKLRGDFPTTEVIERRELWAIQQNIFVTPPTEPPATEPKRDIEE